jgi:hypothetical protein
MTAAVAPVVVVAAVLCQIRALARTRRKKRRAAHGACSPLLCNHLGTPEAAPSTGACELRAACEATRVALAGGLPLSARSSCASEGNGQQFPHPHPQMTQPRLSHGRASGRTTSAIL